jgi:guanylate kinase
VSDERPRTFPVILAGPSGAGKTTVRDRLLADPLGLPFRFSVSMTTRAPREGEVHGVDYRFVDRPRFLELVDAGGMLEHAEVHGELYGTPRENLVEALAEDAFLLLDIDVQGARQLRESTPEAVSIFLVPPSSACGDAGARRTPSSGVASSPRWRSWMPYGSSTTRS